MEFLNQARAGRMRLFLEITFTARVYVYGSCIYCIQIQFQEM